MSRQHLFYDSRGRKGRLLKGAYQGSAQTSASPLFPIRTCYIGRKHGGGAESKFFGTAGCGKPAPYLFIVALKAVKTLRLNTSTKNSVLQALKTTFEKGKHFAIVKAFPCHLSSQGSWNAHLNSFSLVCYPRRKLMFGTLFLLLSKV